ncbi:beta-ketoacyl-[acyl-carrier-protein] synthase family protein [Nonomuraea roseoviolacea]|uniref:Act minimal PKS ketosynthase (KS/KS alpha) n=1 Tax=Nonomuraea roseoviolacea subsp. carminata TaxID=160689 RepID=A0ABT1JRU5_9ACTN|nr:beta-ketoacyl-[acyl-carrier-protein] synthase family protein [Nonomuraea roseoviolacea]MCP2344077.1 act minimal PKS ketosynthase (KS/KS alpha) [Nonomuraea roseoviolacea subsp. carminata]
MSRRVVITGLGVIAPGGIGVKPFWDLLMSGATATRRITAFDPAPFRSQMAAEADFDPDQAGLPDGAAERLDRAAQFALAACGEAMADSGLRVEESAAHRTGVAIGSAVGCTQKLESEYVAISGRGATWEVDHTLASPYLYDYFVPSSMAAEVAWAVGAQGPVSMVSAGCTSGIDAIGYACELIREGSADVMVTGGTDAPIAPITVACFDAIKATSSYNDTPGSASRPFDRTRNGFVLGEGAAVLVLEEAEAARRRGARVYAEITGYASRGNAYHMTGLRSDGAEMAAAITAALDEARCDPSEIGYVNAHGTATKQNDRHETAAIKTALGEHARRVPISSIKSMIGHSLGAIGSIEVAAAALAVTRSAIPPTANLHEPDPELDLDYVPLVAREQRVDVVLTVGSGFGGFQSAMLLRRFEG